MTVKTLSQRVQSQFSLMIDALVERGMPPHGVEREILTNYTNHLSIMVEEAEIKSGITFYR